MKPEDMIIYEDREILVCYKEAGIPVQSANIQVQDLESMLKNYLRSPYLGIIQRLDQPVEGLLVFAKSPEAAKGLNRQMQEQKIQKYYLAVTQSVPSEKEGKLEDYLMKSRDRNTSQVVKKGTRGSKRAYLEYRVLEEKDEKALLQIKLGTGRHHQIRVQTAHAGFPLWGDQKYNPLATAEFGPKIFPALCAWKLEFTHPATGKKLCFRKKPEMEIFQKFATVMEME